ncbi:MAG: CBS domain-containing protein [Methylophilaceae bacterium]|jgi:CBS domain-containing protein|uniref:CBS domain-containing protein n=1 Tax=Methylobacillus sp. MM3 TaxID=1848039 RepID=UPI0007E20734|nr:CBS domain-containing protein [Methylobacillus sp. MM3]OAJ70052.1 histidine kinase [Methylobacillus sp. MM3]
MKTVRQLLDAKGGPTLSVSSDATVYEALVIMAEKHIGALLVMDEDRLVGIFSERDYARNVVLKGKSSKDTPIKEIMTPGTLLITVNPGQTVEECLNLVTDKRIRHLPVLEEGKVIGVLSIGDLVKATIEYQQFLIKQLESYIHS